MTEQGGGEGEIDPRLVEVAADPRRFRVLSFVYEHSGTAPFQVARALGLDLEVVKTTLDELGEKGLVERAGGAGDGEPGYRALARTIWSEEELAALSTDERQRLFAWIVRMIGADVEIALSSGSLSRNPETHVSRSVSTVDLQGWHELTRIQEEALSAVLAVEEAAAERLAERGDEGFQVLSAMLCCELPNEDELLSG